MSDSNDRKERARKLDGSINVGLGGPGSGKTHWMTRLSVAAAYFGGPDGKPVPWYGYDANGDVQKHLIGMVRGEILKLEDAKARRDRQEVEKLERRIAYLTRVCMRNLYRGHQTLPQLLARVDKLIDDGVHRGDDNPITGPQAILYIDEAGAVRDKDENFWPQMRQARNAGLTVYSSGHRVVDWHPAALACIRAVILWQHNLYKFYEINGMKIPREKCGVPKDKLLKFVTGADPTIQSWDTSKPGYPPELITPAYPTVATPMGF